MHEKTLLLQVCNTPPSAAEEFLLARLSLQPT